MNMKLGQFQLLRLRDRKKNSEELRMETTGHLGTPSSRPSFTFWGLQRRRQKEWDRNYLKR
jgi:hypothetical protein